VWKEIFVPHPAQSVESMRCSLAMNNRHLRLHHRCPSGLQNCCCVFQKRDGDAAKVRGSISGWTRPGEASTRRVVTVMKEVWNSNLAACASARTD